MQTSGLVRKLLRDFLSDLRFHLEDRLQGYLTTLFQRVTADSGIIQRCFTALKQELHQPPPAVDSQPLRNLLEAVAEWQRQARRLLSLDQDRSALGAAIARSMLPPQLESPTRLSGPGLAAVYGGKHQHDTLLLVVDHALASQTTVWWGDVGISLGPPPTRANMERCLANQHLKAVPGRRLPGRHYTNGLFGALARQYSKV